MPPKEYRQLNALRLMAMVASAVRIPFRQRLSQKGLGKGASRGTVNNIAPQDWAGKWTPRTPAEYAACAGRTRAERKAILRGMRSAYPEPIQGVPAFTRESAASLREHRGLKAPRVVAA